MLRAFQFRHTVYKTTTILLLLTVGGHVVKYSTQLVTNLVTYGPRKPLSWAGKAEWIITAGLVFAHEIPR